MIGADPDYRFERFRYMGQSFLLNLDSSLRRFYDRSNVEGHVGLMPGAEREWPTDPGLGACLARRRTMRRMG
jgi:hypothetical protein